MEKKRPKISYNLILIAVAVAVLLTSIYLVDDLNIYSIGPLKPKSTLALLSATDLLNDLETYQKNKPVETIEIKPTEKEDEPLKVDITIPSEEPVIEVKIIEEEVKEGVSLLNSDGKLRPFFVFKFSSAENWENRYGKLLLEDGKLLIGSSDGTSSFAKLIEEGDWRDYTFETSLDWHRGSSVSLVFRYQDSKNYAYCGYSLYGNRVTMYTVENGERISHGQSPKLAIPHFEPWKDISIGVLVRGSVAKCIKNNDEVLTYSLEGMPDFGGVGIKTWSKERGYTLISVKSISIDPR